MSGSSGEGRRPGAAVALIGYRGTGKSTVARLVAQRLGWPCIDSDQEIERLAGLPISRIFAERGEQAFRELEATVLEQLDWSRPAVVSLGGGAVLRPANRDAVRRARLIVWLDAQPETLAQRLASDASSGARRPSLTGLDPLDEIRALVAQRAPVYQALADRRIATDAKMPSEVGEEILSLLERRR